MLDKEILKSIEVHIIKASKDIRQIRTQEYLSKIKDKPWKHIALNYIVLFTDKILDLLDKYSIEISDLLSSKKGLFNTHIVKSNIKDYKTYEYLDEWYNHVIVDDIKDELVELNKKFYNELDKAYDLAINQGLNKEVAETVYKDLGMQFNFNKFDKITSKYLEEKKINWAKQVSKTNEDLVKKYLKKGFEDGLDSYDTAQLIQNSTGFKFSRAEAIARTEVMSSCNHIDYIAYMQNDAIIELCWSTTNDADKVKNRSRDTHKKANGQRISKDGCFEVGGFNLKYPGDSSLGAPAKEVINCRCIIRPIFKDKITLDEYDEIGRNALGRGNAGAKVENSEDNQIGTKFSNKLEVQKEISKEYKKALITKFNKGTKLAKEVFLKYVQDNSVSDTMCTNGAYYSSDTNSINMNFEEDLSNESGAGTTYFHEHGHLIDGAFGFLSIKTNFSDIIKIDYENYLKSYMKENKIKSKKEAYGKIADELWNINNKHLFSSVSDLLGGLSKDKIKGPYGHSKDYWKHDDYMFGLEAFAHFFEAQFENKRLEVLERYFPLSNNIFNQYMEALRWKT